MSKKLDVDDRLNQSFYERNEDADDSDGSVENKFKNKRQHDYTVKYIFIPIF